MAMQSKSVIIAGGRDFVPTDKHREWLKNELIYQKADLVITGGATGADAFGLSISIELGIRNLQILPNWSRYGKRAGPLRNEEMSDLGKMLIAFPGGPGTKSMCDIMIKQKKKVIFYPTLNEHMDL